LIIQPFLRGFVQVKLKLFFFRRDPYLSFHRGIAYDNEVPGLEVGTIRCCSGCTQAIFNYFSWHGTARELAYGAPTLHLGSKLGSSSPHFVSGILAISGERGSTQFCHFDSPDWKSNRAWIFPPRYCGIGSVSTTIRKWNALQG
jgi:hypothetical protein